MVLDDPAVLVLIVVVAIFLFGSAKIPQFARSLGEARREFTRAFNGMPTEEKKASQDDPLVIAAKNEGILTEGKTRAQISEELALKIGANK